MDQRCLTVVDTFSSKLPIAAGTYLMSCFMRWRATGLEFRFCNKLKFLLWTGTHYSIAYRFVLNASLASFVSLESISWIRLLLVSFNGYVQREQAFETPDKDSLCSLKIKASIDLVLQLQNFPEGPIILQNCKLGAKHLELEHRPHIHNRGFRAQGGGAKSSEARDKA